MNHSGEMIIKETYGDFSIYSEIVLEDKVLIITEKDGKKGLRYQNGTEILPEEFDYISYYGDNYLVLNQEGISSISDIEGNIIVDSIDGYVDSMGEDAFIIRTDGTYGLFDFAGNTLIGSVYDNMFFCSDSDEEGCVWAENGEGKYGCLDRNGQEIIPFLYESLTEYDDYIIAAMNGKYGILNKDMDWIVSPEYDDINSMDINGYFVVRQEEKYGVIDRKGNTILYPEYEYIGHNYWGESDFLGSIIRNDYYGVVNRDYDIVVPIEYTDISIFDEDGLCRGRKEDGTYDLFDKDGHMLVGSATWVSGIGTGGLISVNRSDYDTEYYSSSFCNSMGSWKLSIDDGYALGSILECGLARVYDRDSGKYGYINTKGDLAIECIYDDAHSFTEDGIASVCIDEEWGYINELGEMVVPCQYYDVMEFENGYGVVVSEDEKEGLVSLKGDLIIPCVYDSIANWGDTFDLNLDSEWITAAKTGYILN